MLVKIDVTQECIDKGCRGQATNCAVFHAINPLLKGPNRDNVHCAVTKDVISIHKDYFTVAKIKTPLVARNFISDYDAGNEVAPISFELDIPEELLL